MNPAAAASPADLLAPAAPGVDSAGRVDRDAAPAPAHFHQTPKPVDFLPSPTTALPPAISPAPGRFDYHTAAAVADAPRRPMPNLARKPRPNLLRRINERTVFDLVRRTGPTSRADLKRLTGVSAPTISKAVAHLLGAGLLEEVGTAPAAAATTSGVVTGVGRPVVVYRLARESVQVLGANIGARTCSVFAASLDGDVDPASVTEFPTPAAYDAIITAVAAAARALVIRAGRRTRTLGLGLTAPGEIDARAGRVLFSPNLRLLDNRLPAADLRHALKLDVSLVHDTLASAMAEQFYGVARDLSDFVRIGVYEAFGMSAVINGRLLEGRSGLAGELGHVTVDVNGPVCTCGNRGCLETLATDPAFARAASKRLGRNLSPEQAVRLAQSGDADLRPELHRALDYLAVGTAAAINLFNPQAVLVCSRMFDAAPDAFDRFRQATTTRSLRPLAESCQILRTAPNVRQGAIAAFLDVLTDSLGPVMP